MKSNYYSKSFDKKFNDKQLFTKKAVIKIINKVVDDVIFKTRKTLAVEGVLSMSVEKALSEILNK